MLPCVRPVEAEKDGVGIEERRWPAAGAVGSSGRPIPGTIFSELYDILPQSAVSMERVGKLAYFGSSLTVRALISDTPVSAEYDLVGHGDGRPRLPAL